jgi:hypothetical protein
VKLDVKTTLIVALSIVIALLSTCHSCVVKKYEKQIAELQKGSGSSTSKSDTVYKIDSVKTVILNPVPYETVRKEYKVDYKFDTLYIEGIDTVYVDTLVARHYAVNKYSDVTKLEHGYIISEETISQNKIVSKTIRPFITIPTITNTITKTEYKGVLYLGIDAYGNSREIINGAGVSLLYKSPRALAYEVGAYWNSFNQTNYKAGIKFPLTLNLKKK